MQQPKNTQDRGLNNTGIIRLEAQEANSDVLYIYSDLLNPRSSPTQGTPSYLLSGLGNDLYLSSAAHGAGRAISRFDLTRAGANYTESDLGLTGVDCITLR